MRGAARTCEVSRSHPWSHRRRIPHEHGPPPRSTEPKVRGSNPLGRVARVSGPTPGARGLPPPVPHGPPTRPATPALRKLFLAGASVVRVLRRQPVWVPEDYRGALDVPVAVGRSGSGFVFLAERAVHQAPHEDSLAAPRSWTGERRQRRARHHLRDGRARLAAFALPADVVAGPPVACRCQALCAEPLRAGAVSGRCERSTNESSAPSLASKRCRTSNSASTCE